jgi:hypothetical protein
MSPSKLVVGRQAEKRGNAIRRTECHIADRLPRGSRRASDSWPYQPRTARLTVTRAD